MLPSKRVTRKHEGPQRAGGGGGSEREAECEIRPVCDSRSPLPVCVQKNDGVKLEVEVVKVR